MTAQPELIPSAAALSHPTAAEVPVRVEKVNAPKTPKGPRYRALKRIRVGEKVYKPGQLVPEAKDWLRVEAWVRSRHLELAE